MLPGTLLAGALLLSLVPGWIFLRLTERVRRPRHESDLGELLELVAVGVATTGLACLSAAIVRPTGIHDLAWPPKGPADIRELGLTVLALLLVALLLAILAAWVVIKRSPSPNASLVTSVWWEVFRADRIPAGKAAYVAVTLKDDQGIVEGVLDAFTWQSDADHRRDIALKAPIRYQAGVGDDGKIKYRKPGYDKLVIDGEAVKDIALRYVSR